MAKSLDEIKKRVAALLARAADEGASEAERRTSAVIAAKLMREHKLSVGAGEVPPAAELASMTRAHLEVVVNGARTVVDVMSAGLGFDVFAFAQNLLRERVQGALAAAVAAPPSKAKKPRAKARKR